MMARSDDESVPKYRKARIPAALREQVWIAKMGYIFESKCPVTWCQNRLTVFDFQSGHNVPESKGGTTTLDNLIPLCSRCNLSMSDNYTIDEWSSQYQAIPKGAKKGWRKYLCFL